VPGVSDSRGAAAAAGGSHQLSRPPSRPCTGRPGGCRRPHVGVATAGWQHHTPWQQGRQPAAASIASAALAAGHEQPGGGRHGPAAGCSRRGGGGIRRAPCQVGPGGLGDESEQGRRACLATPETQTFACNPTTWQALYGPSQLYAMLLTCFQCSQCGQQAGACTHDMLALTLATPCAILISLPPRAWLGPAGAAAQCRGPHAVRCVSACLCTCP
jgi:hypothetical protein